MTLDFDRARDITEKLVRLSAGLPSNEAPERAGGYLTIGMETPGRVTRIYSFPIGVMPSADGDETNLEELYRNFSREKFHRLQADWHRDHSIVSSWQTRDVEMHRYGGGVLLLPEGCNNDGSHYIITFSGLKEHVDEATSLVLGRQLGLTQPDREKRIVQISDNKVFDEMLGVA
jgi:hypothetical protein